MLFYVIQQSSSRWKPSLLMSSLADVLSFLFFRLEAIAITLEAIANRLEAIAARSEAIAKNKKTGNMV